MSIRVNEVEITDDEIYAEMQYHPSFSVEEVRQEATQALVIRELLLQEAKKKRLLEDGKEEGEIIDRLIQKEVVVPEADEESCKRYYEKNKERFIDKSTGELLPFESVYSHIRDYLHVCSLSNGISQYINLLVSNARVVGFEVK